MTSVRNPDDATANSYRVRFPPRVELQPGVTIRPLPLLGTTWYERGFMYWVRRLGIGILFAVVAVVYILMIQAAISDISPSGSALYDGLLAGEIVFTVVSGVLLFRRMWRNMINGMGATRRDTKRASRTAAGIGPLAYVAGGALAGLAVFCSLITAGLVLAAFAVWLVPFPPMEQYERRMLAERIRVRHDLEGLSPRSKHYGSKNHHQKR